MFNVGNTGLPLLDVLCVRRPVESQTLRECCSGKYRTGVEIIGNVISTCDGNRLAPPPRKQKKCKQEINEEITK